MGRAPGKAEVIWLQAAIAGPLLGGRGGCPGSRGWQNDAKSVERPDDESRKTEEREEAIVPKSDKYPGLYKERLLKKPS